MGRAFDVGKTRSPISKLKGKRSDDPEVIVKNDRRVGMCSQYQGKRAAQKLMETYESTSDGED